MMAIAASVDVMLPFGRLPYMAATLPSRTPATAAACGSTKPNFRNRLCTQIRSRSVSTWNDTVTEHVRTDFESDESGGEGSQHHPQPDNAVISRADVFHGGLRSNIPSLDMEQWVLAPDVLDALEHEIEREVSEHRATQQPILTKSEPMLPVALSTKLEAPATATITITTVCSEESRSKSTSEENLTDLKDPTFKSLYHPDGRLARSNGLYEQWVLELKAKERNVTARALHLLNCDLKILRVQVKRYQLKLSQRRFRLAQNRRCGKSTPSRRPVAV